MKMYEEIFDILEEKGTATIPLICREINMRSSNTLKNLHAIEYSYIKSLITSKNEIFLMKDGLVSIRPEKEPVKLTVVLHGYPGPELRVYIDFVKKRFTYFEWHLDSPALRPILLDHLPGSVENFKKKLYALNIWDWKEDYQGEGIIVDGTSWFVKLETKGEIYERGGLDTFPKEWVKFLRSISSLIGKNIS